MSEVHDQALHLLTVPQIGTFLTPEGREMVLRALNEVDSLRQRAEKAEQNAKMWEARAELGVSVLKGIFGKDSPAAPIEDVEVPSATPLPTEPAGDVSPNSQQEPEPRDQVAGVEGSTDEGPASAPEQDREDSAHRLAGSADPGEGATASPAAAKWGRADGKGAFHLWREGFSESECAEEVCDGDVLYSDPIPDNACLSCAAIAGWDVPEQMGKPETQRELPTIRRTCAGFNKSADVPCGSPNVSVAYNGKWFCRRHDPTKSKVCLMAGCGRAGRTAKGSPGIWCKEHGEKLSAEERTAIARVNRLPEAANA